jgi:hypothetical protein
MHDDPYQATDTSLNETSSGAASRSFLSRLAVAFVSAFVVVFLTALSSGGSSFDLASIAVGALFTMVFSLIAAVCSAALFRKDVAVVVGAQIITVALFHAFISLT